MVDRCKRFFGPADVEAWCAFLTRKRKSRGWRLRYHRLMTEGACCPGRESVWDYPHPPRVEPCLDHLRVEPDGETLADTEGVYRVFETSHAPTYYIPQVDVKLEFLRRSRRSG